MEFNMQFLPLLAAAAPLVGSLFNIGGSKGKTKSTYNKGQQGLIDEVVNTLRQMKGQDQNGSQNIQQSPAYEGGMDFLNSLFSDPEFFKNFEQPLQRQFEEQTIPDLANRFAAMGSGGSLGSTAFRNQLGREGSNLSSNIAALRGQMQQQAVPQALQYAQQPISNYMNLLQTALGHPTQNVYQPASNPLSPIAAYTTSAFASPFAQQWAQSLFGNNQFAGQYPTTN
jgi:hypothetical protein